MKMYLHQGKFSNLWIYPVANVKLDILSLGWSVGLVYDFALEIAHLGRKDMEFILFNT